MVCPSVIRMGSGCSDGAAEYTYASGRLSHAHVEPYSSLSFAHAWRTSEACSSHPVAPVQGCIVVYELLLKECRPLPPVHAVLYDEEAGHVLPPSVRHVACLVELLHAGVHQRHPCLAGLPPLQQLQPWVPLYLDARLQASLQEDPFPMFGGKEFVEISGEQFECDPVSRLVGHTVSFVAPQLMRHAPRGHAAVSQPGRKLGGVVPP
mmetsp:Transcript_26184/g.73406  ORF Transcript_26184/g.73406 Transcript_26184/m.73406 type:complete len:207 (+) Transcript_26184:158-778(+)